MAQEPTPEKVANAYYGGKRREATPDRAQAFASSSPIQTRTYHEATAEATAQRFAADAGEAAKHGWVATSQTWEGPSLTVVYQSDQQPTQETTQPAPHATTPPPSGTETVGDLAKGLPLPALGIIIGGVMAVVGSFLPWVQATSAFGTASRSGLDGDGIFTLILGGVVIVAGIGTRRRGRSWVTGLIASLLLLGVGVVDLQDVSGRISDSGEYVVASVGIGLWLVIAGAVIAAIASLSTWSASRR